MSFARRLTNGFLNKMRSISTSSTVPDASPTSSIIPDTGESIGSQTSSLYDNVPSSDPSRPRIIVPPMRRVQSEPAPLSAKIFPEDDSPQSPYSPTSPTGLSTPPTVHHLQDLIVPPPSETFVIPSIPSSPSSSLENEKDLEEEKKETEAETATLLACFLKNIKNLFFKLPKLALGFLSSLPLSINTNSGVYIFLNRFIPDTHLPQNLKELAANGFSGVLFADITAFFAACCSLIVNICQFFDFAPQLKEDMFNILKKLKKPLKDWTRKDYATVLGLIVSIAAAIDSGKIAFDATKDAPQWYLRLLIGILSTLATFLMTMATRGVSTNKAISNIEFLYHADDRPALHLVKELSSIKTNLLMTKKTFEFKTYGLTYYKDEIILKESFKKYGLSIQESEINYLLKVRETLNDTPISFSQRAQKSLNYLFTLINVLMGWSIYMEKLASMFPVVEGSGIGRIFWDVFRYSLSAIGASPHTCLFYYASKEIMENLQTSFKLSPTKTIAAFITTLFTSFSLFNIEFNIENEKRHDRLFPMPNPNTPEGWITPTAAFSLCFWVNLNSFLKMLILNTKLDEEKKALAENPYHTLFKKITNEENPLPETKDIENPSPHNLSYNCATQYSLAKSRTSLFARGSDFEDPLLNHPPQSSPGITSKFRAYAHSLCGRRG